ncbi:MAG: hypothetical protein AAGJ95_01285 [Cyanobacteria bacterium J06554_11]
MKDNARFLVKVIAFSAVFSVLIKVGGPGISLKGVDSQTLNRWAIAIILLPSLTIGSILGAMLLQDRPD